MVSSTVLIGFRCTLYSDSPSSKFVPAMNGIFENFPSASSLDGTSGTTPFGPSRTGTNKNGSGKDAAVSLHAASSVVVSALCMHGNVPPAEVVAHAGTSETNLSQATPRRDALKKGIVPADPDSNIYTATFVRKGM